MTYFKIDASSPVTGPRIVTDCPHCGKGGTFDKTDVNDIYSAENFIGFRICSNPACKGPLFYIKEKSGTITIYPPVKLTFSREGIPIKVLAAFEEAVTSHANQCYMAAGIMLRKTLEEICGDQNAKGDNLYKRLVSLSKIIVVPSELMEATHELRMIGNDAAHLESESYEKIGREEIEISIEFTKEILKAVYQYQGLLGRMRSLKKPTQT